MKLGAIGTAADAVATGLDQLREGVMRRITEAELELTPGDPGSMERAS